MEGKASPVLFAFVLGALGVVPVRGADEERVYVCPHVEKPVTVRAGAPDAAWAAAPLMRLVEVRNGAAPTQETEVRALWSDEGLYIRFDCRDSDVWGTLTERDSFICREEVVEIFLDPNGDRETYYEIEVSPLGTIYDLFILNGGQGSAFRYLAGWDCAGLETAIEVRGDVARGAAEDEGWSVTVGIPFSEMITAPNRPPKAGDRWRWNLYRIDRSDEGNEHSAWSPTGEVNFHRPHRFGTLEFAGSTAR